MIIKVHRIWIVEEIGPSFQGCAPDITKLAQFETEEEARAYKRDYEQSMKNECWMGSVCVYPKDIDIVE